MSPSSFPPALPCPGTAFPPQGPAGRFPCFTGTTQCSDSSPFVPRHFVAFVRRYRPGTQVRPRRAGMRRPWARSWSAGLLAGVFEAETTRSPRFLGVLCVHALLYDPGGTAHPATPVCQCCLPLYPQRRLPRRYSLRGSITRPGVLLPPAPYSPCGVCTRSSLLSCWLGVAQVGLESANSHPLGNDDLFPSFTSPP